MSFTLPPYTDGQTVHGDGVDYTYELANNRLKVKTNDVTSSSTETIPTASITPDKTDFAATFGVNTPPTSPTLGQVVVVGPSPTGLFTGKTDHLEIWNGSVWLDIAPYEGLIVWDMVANTLKAWNGDAWSSAVPVAPASIPDSSINTSAIVDNAVTIAKANFKVISRTLMAAPTAVLNDSYIVSPTPIGGDAWFGQTGKLAVKTGAGVTSADWAFYPLASGKLYWIDAEAKLYGYSGAALVLVGPVVPPGVGSVTAAMLSDFSDLSNAQVDNIVAKIDADSDALAALKAALNITPVGIPTYSGSQFSIGSFVMSSDPSVNAWAMGIGPGQSRTMGSAPYQLHVLNATGTLIINYGTWLFCGATSDATSSVSDLWVRTA